MNRYRDWLDQAHGDLEHARRSIPLGDFAWACFAAHQAAEAAAKALHARRGSVAWGHSVASLLRELPDVVRPGSAVMDSARVLDRHYIPTRYPDAHPAGSARQNYTETDAEAAVRAAEAVVGYCEHQSLDG